MIERTEERNFDYNTTDVLYRVEAFVRVADANSMLVFRVMASPGLVRERPEIVRDAIDKAWLEMLQKAKEES